MANLYTPFLSVPDDTHQPSHTRLIPFNSQTANNFDPALPRDIPAAIPQTERLFTTRSRTAATPGPEGRGEYAYIKILTSDVDESMSRHASGHDSKPTSLGTDSSGVLSDAVKGGGYASFLLTDLRCSLDEKLQVVEVFGDAEVSYYFGRQPISFEFSGVLVDSVDNNWFVEWLEMYTHVMRGSQLARNYELIRLVLPNMIITGTIPRMSWSQNGNRDVDIPFSFSFLAKQVVPIKTMLPGKPLTNDPVINWDKASGFLTQAGINEKKIASAKAKAEELRNVVGNPLSTTKDYSQALSNFGQGMTGFNPSLDYQGGDITRFGGGSTDANSNATSPTSGVSDLFAGITSNLTGIRATLFSPVYGVLSSLTKLIKGSSGSLNGVVGSFTTPVRDILRDVRNISNQAIGVVNLINNSINSVTNEFNNVNSDILSTVSLLKKTKGVITTAPESISVSLKRLVNSGKLPLSAGFLRSREVKVLPSGQRISTKIVLLNAGKPHTPERGAKL
jgi:hypothetical protein